MKIYKENNFSKIGFLIVSFFTQNYKSKADMLIDSLNKFNLNYKIFEIPTIHYSKSDKGSDDINYCMPNLIIKMINKYRIPIIFMDCDLVLMEEPKLFYKLKEKCIDFSIYNWLADKDNDGYMPLKVNFLKETEVKHESKLLYLNSEKAKRILNWETKLDFKKSLEITINWYKSFLKKGNALASCLKDINYFENISNEK